MKVVKENAVEVVLVKANASMKATVAVNMV